jgi:DNA-binding MarR family transcriptional regulator
MGVTIGGLTRRQFEAREAIARLTPMRGEPPTFRELGCELGVCGEVAAKLVRRLEKRGHVTRIRYAPRSIRLTRLPEGMTVSP